MTLKQIVLNKSATSLVKNNTHIQRQGNPTMKFLVWNPLTSLRLQIWLKANQFHLPKPVIAWDFPTSTDVIVIKLIPSLSSWGKQVSPSTQKKKKKGVIPWLMLSWKILSGILLFRWHQQVRPTSPALHVIIIKWHHMITWNRLQHCYSGC